MALMASWPAGQSGRIGIRSLQVTAAGKPVSGLMLLYARALGLRKLRAQLRRALRGER